MVVTPFRVYSRLECKALAEKLLPKVQHWSRRWFNRASSVTSFRNIDGTDGPLFMRWEEEHVSINCIDTRAQWRIALDASEDSLALITALMLGIDRESTAAASRGDVLFDLQSDMAVDCLQNLGANLAGRAYEQSDVSAGARDAAAIKALCAIYGTGWGVLTIQCDELQLEVLIGPLLIENYLPTPAIGVGVQLCPAKQAIVGQQTSLRATLGGTLLTIGEFEKLRSGDVVKLDQQVSAPVVLETLAGEEVASGELGVKNGHKAVRLA